MCWDGLEFVGFVDCYDVVGEVVYFYFVEVCVFYYVFEGLLIWMFVD